LGGDPNARHYKEKEGTEKNEAWRPPGRCRNAEKQHGRARVSRAGVAV